MILTQYTCDGVGCTNRICTKILNKDNKYVIPKKWLYYKGYIYCGVSCRTTKENDRAAYTQKPKVRKGFIKKREKAV